MKKILYGIAIALLAFCGYFFGSQQYETKTTSCCDSTKQCDSLKDSCKTADSLSDTTFQVTP